MGWTESSELMRNPDEDFPPFKVQEVGKDGDSGTVTFQDALT